MLTFLSGTALRILGPAVFAKMPWRLLAWLALAAGITAGIVGVKRWDGARLEARYVAGAAAQKRVDEIAVVAAERAATKLQHDTVTRAVANQAAISKGSTDALTAKNDSLGRAYDDLRLRWAARNSAVPGGAGKGGASALPNAAAGYDAAACQAAGWVDYDVAAAAAEGADRATALADQFQEWTIAQAAAWPK